MGKPKTKLSATCIWCGKDSEPYPIHIQCFEILEVYNTMLSVYQQEYPRGWIDFLNLRTRTAADRETNKAIKDIMEGIAKAGEKHRELLDDDFWKEHWPERIRKK